MISPSPFFVESSNRSHKGMFLGIEAAGDAQTTQLLGVWEGLVDNMGVEPKIGAVFPPKMDCENNGKPTNKNGGFGGTTISGNTHMNIYVYILYDHPTPGYVIVNNSIHIWYIDYNTSYLYCISYI